MKTVADLRATCAMLPPNAHVFIRVGNELYRLNRVVKEPYVMRCQGTVTGYKVMLITEGEPCEILDGVEPPRICADWGDDERGVVGEEPL